jgi:hypothetical protein
MRCCRRRCRQPFTALGSARARTADNTGATDNREKVESDSWDRAAGRLPSAGNENIDLPILKWFLRAVLNLFSLLDAISREMGCSCS